MHGIQIMTPLSGSFFVWDGNSMQAQSIWIFIEEKEKVKKKKVFMEYFKLSYLNKGLRKGGKGNFWQITI